VAGERRGLWLAGLLLAGCATSPPPDSSTRRDGGLEDDWLDGEDGVVEQSWGQNADIAPDIGTEQATQSTGPVTGEGTPPGLIAPPVLPVLGSEVLWRMEDRLPPTGDPSVAALVVARCPAPCTGSLLPALLADLAAPHEGRVDLALWLDGEPATGTLLAIRSRGYVGPVCLADEATLASWFGEAAGVLLINGAGDVVLREDLSSQGGLRALVTGLAEVVTAPMCVEDAPVSDAL